MYAEGVFDYLLLYIWAFTRTLYIPSEPMFGDQYLHCSGIDSCLKAIFWKGRQFSVVILQFCSVAFREKNVFLLHSLSSRCVKFCTVRIIEQVILNLDYHGILVNIIFRSWISRVSCGHITIKVLWLNRGHTLQYFSLKTDHCLPFYYVMMLCCISGIWPWCQ